MVWKLEFYCQTLLNNFVVKTQMFRVNILLYLTLLVYLQLWFGIKTSKPKRERERERERERGSRVPFKNLQKLYTQVGAIFGSMRNSVKAENPPVSQMRQLTSLKPSYTKFTFAARKFRSIKAFAGFKMRFGVCN